VAWDKWLEIERINENLYTINKLINNKLLFLSKDIDIYYEKIDNISSNKLNKFDLSLNNEMIKLNKIDDIVVKAKAEAAKEIAVESNMEYKMYAGSKLMTTNVLETND
jgi:hypothetical protein